MTIITNILLYHQSKKGNFKMINLKELKDLVQSTIDKGATSVEEIHNAIASMPLNVLEKITPLETSAKKIKEFHENSVGTVYNVIRKVNDEVGKLAEELISKTETIKNESENY